MARSIDDIIGKYRQGKREDLIPLMQEVQEEFGYLSEEYIVRIGSHLGLSTTKIYGLATFYDQFRFVPGGKIKIKICNGTSCFMNGAGAVISKIREETGLEPGQTDREGLFSYDIVTCMGGCQKGPVLKTGEEYLTTVTPEQIPGLLSKLKYITDSD